MNTIAYILIFGLLGSLMASVLYGLWWAIQRGQFSDLHQASTSIFDAEEPEGYRTDAFPGERNKQSDTTTQQGRP